MRLLVTGWFSFIDGHATAGDLLSRDVVCHWLDAIDLAYDIAVAAPFSGGVDWRRVNPDDYSHVLFVCGPFQPSGHEHEFLERFARCRLVGLNLSLSEPKLTWNPFDLVLERDSPDCVRPDLAFLSPPHSVPVVGLCLVESYPGAWVDKANEAINRLMESREMAIVRVDTRLDVEGNNTLRTPAEIESVINCTHLLITTRLHGLVLALKRGIPAIAIDPEPGGAKILRQAELLGWPHVLVVDRMDDQALIEAFEHCLTDASRLQARACSERARELLRGTFATFVEEMRGSGSMDNQYKRRLASAAAPGSLEESVRASSRSWRQRLSDGWRRLRKRLGVPQT